MRIAIVDDLSTDSEALRKLLLPLGIGTGDSFGSFPCYIGKRRGSACPFRSECL